MTGRWILAMAAPGPFLSANHRRHWAAEAALVAEWRSAAHWQARAAKLPHLPACHITATLHFTDRRHRDTHNFYPTIKAVVDGLVDYGLIPDDKDPILTGPDLRLGSTELGGYGRVELVITERVLADV